MNLMNLLRSFTIRTRMLGAIAMVIGLFGLLGATGLIGGMELRDLNQHFMVHSTKEAGNVAAIRYALGDILRHEKDMVIDYADPAMVVQHQRAWQAAVDRAKDSFSGLLEGDADDDNPVAQDALQRVDQYVASTASVLRTLRDGGYDSSAAIVKMLGSAKEHFTAVEAAANRIDAIVKAEARATEVEFEQSLRTAAWVYVGVLLLIMALVAPLTLMNSRSIVGPLEEAEAMAVAIARGDLTRVVRIEGNDESTRLLQALTTMQVALQRMVGDIRQTTESITTASAEIASGNQDLSGRTEQTASSLQQTASSMEQLTSTVRQTADSARTANQLASAAASAAQRGGQVVAEVVQNMEEISASSRKIGEIIGVIDSIAFQTNILALNAAVEAARAGEQGRGFAVVAGEVRNLAQRSANAAREIKGLIAASVEKVDSGGRLVHAAGSTIGELVSDVQRVNDIIGEITAAAGDQSTELGHVNIAVTQLDQMTQQNAALVEQSAAAAESLREQSQRLGQLVSAFQVADGASVPAVVPSTPVAAARQAAARPSPRPVKPSPPVQTAAPVRSQSQPAVAVAAAGAAADDEWTTF